MAKFVSSALTASQLPHHSKPEFSLVGASNSGKSTLINALAREKIAHTSKKPGKTRTLNFYDFDSFYLVDMPGYGYASVSKSMKLRISKILDSYFLDRESILGVCQLCSTHGLSNQDLEVFDYLTKRFDNYLLLLNKIDKLSNLQQKKLSQEILSVTRLSPDKLLLVSGKHSKNIDLLRQKFDSWS